MDEKAEINPQNYKIITKIGEGAFGKVFKVEKDNKYYALKKIVITNLTKEEIDNYKNLVDFLSSFNNEYIVKYYCSFVDKDYFNILMEYAGNSNLKKYILNYQKKGEFLEEKIILNIITQICCGLKEIHEANLIHRDLTPENIFINEKSEIKIGDFGEAKKLDSNDKYAISIKGKYQYIAPEIIKGKKYNNKIDIYALGCIIYELFTLNTYYIDKLIENKDGKIDLDIYDIKWQTLIDLLLKKDYHDRPSIEDVYNYIEKNNKKLYKEDNFLNGQLEYEGEYSNGKWNGKGKKYYNGKLDYDGEYVDGKRNGIGKEYDYEGKLRFEGIYLNGKRWSGKGYNEKREIVYQIKDGKGYAKEYNWFNGHLIYEGEYLNGERNGKGKEYNSEDELIFEGEYVNGYRWNGKGKEYNYYGELMFEGEYINGKWNGKGKEYYADGNFEFEGEYFNDYRNGKGKEYNNNGDLIFEGEYSNGTRKQ